MLGYEAPIPTRTSGTELAFGVIALIAGAVLIFLGLLVWRIVAPRSGNWADRFVPIFIMIGAGSAGVLIGVRALRRIRVKQRD